MKEDAIGKLLKESVIKTSDGFADELMKKHMTRQLQKMRQKLFALAGAVIACFGTGAWVLYRSGFQIDAFGVSLELPELGPLIIMGIVGCLTLLHLSNLLQMMKDS